MKKEYAIFLDGEKIGTSFLEFGDAPMGVAFGKIYPIIKNFGYEFIRDYCFSNNMITADHYPNEKYISTRTIDSLKIFNEDGVEIEGECNQIRCGEDEICEISIEGIPYPFYEIEFPQHVEEYTKRFGN